MIDFLEINVNDVEKSRYKQFVVKKIDSKFIKQIEKNEIEFKKAVENKVGRKQKLNSMFYYLSMIFSVVSLILALMVFQQIDIENKTFPMVLFVILLICLGLDIVFGIIQGRIKKEIKTIMNSDEITKYGLINKELESKMLKELGAKEEVDKYDIFVRNVQIKNNEVINAIKASYNNFALYCFKDDNAIYFCDTYELIKLDKKEIQDIQLVKDRISFATWIKKERFTDKKYKEFEIKYSAKGFYSVNSFYEIKILHQGKDFVLRIPGYEKKCLEDIFTYKVNEEVINNEN